MNYINKRIIGSDYENQSVEFLEKNGVVILERNFRCSFGEIDIVGMDKDYTVFFEVKYRQNNIKGYPEEAVSYPKQKKISRVSDYYRVIHKISEFEPLRFDVISIGNDEIRWIKNAFEYRR